MLYLPNVISRVCALLFNFLNFSHQYEPKKLSFASAHKEPLISTSDLKHQVSVAGILVQVAIGLHLHVRILVWSISIYYGISEEIKLLRLTH